MKIPSSSSLIFATLAISSSSSSLSLAAPTGETPGDGMPSSSSNHFIASRRGSFNIPRSESEYFVREQEERVAAAESDHTARAEDVHNSSIDKRALLGDLLKPVGLGAIATTLCSLPVIKTLSPLCGPIPNTSDKAASVETFEAPDDFDVQQAVAQLESIASSVSSAHASDTTAASDDEDSNSTVPPPPPPSPSPSPLVPRNDVASKLPVNPTSAAGNAVGNAPVNPTVAAGSAASQLPVQPTSVVNSAPTPSNLPVNPQDGKDAVHGVAGDAPVRRHWSRHMLRGRALVIPEDAAPTDAPKDAASKAPSPPSPSAPSAPSAHAPAPPVSVKPAAAKLAAAKPVAAASAPKVASYSQDGSDEEDGEDSDTPDDEEPTGENRD